MSEPKWTPGPWIVTTCMDYWVERSGGTPDEEAGIAHCGDVGWPDHDKKQDEWRANAQVIAAAPELYEALAKLTNEVEEICSLAEVAVRRSAGNTNYAVLRVVLVDARAALARARGEP